MLHKFVLALVLVPMALGMTACSDQEEAVGVGVVGGAIIGAAVVSAAESHDRGDYDRGGDYGRGDYGRGNYGRGGDRHYSATLGSPEAHALAKKYSLSVWGAEKVVTAVAQAKAGKLDGFRAAGLNEEDMGWIANGDMPSEDAIASASQSLVSSKASVRALLKDTVKEVNFRREQAWMNSTTANSN